MRRMISQKLQDLLRKLTKSIWADDEGNVEVGKNLEVDGNLNVNGSLKLSNFNSITTMDDGTSLIDYLDSLYSNAKYHHCVTIQYSIGEENPTSATCMICFSADSDKDTPIDSYQDLNRVFGGRRIAITGDAHPDAYPVCIDLHGGTIAEDYLKLWDTANANSETEWQIPLSQLKLVTYKDDVSMN